MNFSDVKQMFIPVGGVNTEVIKVEDSNGNVLWKKSRLPSEYQEVEWIGSDGNPYIDLSDTPPYNCKIETEFAIEESGEGRYAFMVGVTPRYTYARLSMGTWNSKFWVTYGQASEYDTFLYPNTTYDTDFHKWTYDYNDKMFRITDLGLYKDVTGIHMESPTGTMKFFYGMSYGTAGKMKSYKQWNRNAFDVLSLVHDVVPCYRRADSVIGMYDLVTDTFFTNAGSGTFTKGNDV